MKLLAASLIAWVPLAAAYSADIPDVKFYRDATEGGMAEVAMGNLAIGTSTLTVQGTAGDSLSLGTVTLSGNPTYAPAANITVLRGALNDGGAPRIDQSSRRGQTK